MISEKAKKIRKKIISQMAILDLMMKANEWEEMIVLEPAIEKLGLWLSIPVSNHIERINKPYQDEFEKLVVEMLETV